MDVHLLPEVGGPVRALGKESDDVNVWQVWPDNPPRQLPEVVPEEARSLYREASLAENARSLRGAAALYRAAVERICDDRGAAGKNLEDRIEDLANRGADEDLVRDLHEARLTGNWALHEGVEFSAEEVADVADLISQAVYQMYVEPAKREAMREARKRRRKERGREP